MATNEVHVTIPQGTLRGSQETSVLGVAYYSFQQIPYAKPPVGPLRFKAPEPAEGWKGVRDATQKGAICPGMIFINIPYGDECDEDSLCVSVYTKQLPEESGNRKLPVLFHIHGGGFNSGTGNKDLCGPDFFMAEDVVVVSINYRLGALGFLSLQTPEYPGNYGLKDQRLALRWTKDNISYFGGDPDNITIFGCSAGAASVQYHVLSSSCKGLFSKAIAQSGSALNEWALAINPKDCAFLLGKRLGLDTTDEEVLMDFLRKVHPKDIVEKSIGIFQELKGVHPGEELLNFAFRPTVEPEGTVDPFLIKDPSVLLKNGQYQDVPYMSGVCSREMGFVASGPYDFLKWDKDEDFQAFIPRRLKLQKDSDLSLEIAKRIRNHYFKDGVTVDGGIDILSATNFTHGVHRSVKSHVENKSVKSPNYLYIFSYEGDRSVIKQMLGVKDFKGSVHGDDILYVFNGSMMNVVNNIPPMVEGSEDHNVSSKYIKMFVNFAKNGNPTSNGIEVTWPPTDAKTFKYLDIGSQLEVKEGFLSEDMAFWNEIYDLVEKNNDS